MQYPKYQFLVYGWYSDGWLREPDPTRNLGCTLEERIGTLVHALAPIQAEFYTNYTLVTEGGLVCMPPCAVYVVYMNILYVCTLCM